MNERKLGKVALAVFIFVLEALGLSAALTYSPPSPRTGETVTFTLTPSATVSGQVKWDFGDGNPVQATTSLTMTHVYTTVGTYTASATYVLVQQFQTQVDQATVVVTNPRQITFSPPQPKAEQPIAFTALNFYSSCIRWDFGDGSVKNGAAGESHTYANAGSYTVRAYEECGATYGAMVNIAVAAKDVTPPPPTPTQPAMTVAFIRLYFTGGKADVSVAKDSAGLQVFSDIQVTGSGILQWQWRVDDMVFKTDTLAVSFGNKFTLDSGKVPGLPTAIPGRHRVTLRFLQPAVGFSIPAITYFVALKGPAPVITKVTPDKLAPGSEYKLDLEGTDLTSGTEISFPAPLAVVKKANILSPTQAQVVVFVAPTAAPGAKVAMARNEYGASEGPGQVRVGPPWADLPGPNLPPKPQPLACPDIAVVGMKAILLSTQVGDSSVDFPHDTIKLEIEVQNVGKKEVPSDYITDVWVKRNGEVVFGGGYFSWITHFGPPGSRFVIEDVVDSFPHNLPTEYTVELPGLYNECTKENNRASLTIDEASLHRDFLMGQMGHLPKPTLAPRPSHWEQLLNFPHILGWIDCYPNASPPYADAMITVVKKGQYPSNADVKVDGTPLAQGPNTGVYYHAKLSLDNPLGHQFSVSVSLDGETYTGSGGKIDNIVKIDQPAAGTNIYPSAMPQVDFHWTFANGSEPMYFYLVFLCPPPHLVLFSDTVAADHVTLSTASMTTWNTGLQASLAKEFKPIDFGGLLNLTSKVMVFHSNLQPQAIWTVKNPTGKETPPPTSPPPPTIVPFNTIMGEFAKAAPKIEGDIDYFPMRHSSRTSSLTADFRVTFEGKPLSEAVLKVDGLVVPENPSVPGWYHARNLSLNAPVGHIFTIALTYNGVTYTGSGGKIDDIVKITAPADGATISLSQPKIDFKWTYSNGPAPMRLQVLYMDQAQTKIVFDQVVNADHASVPTAGIPGNKGALYVFLSKSYADGEMDGVAGMISKITVHQSFADPQIKLHLSK